jgi:MoaA/NifB/PqqE/SkfB family radical SAM enzyme
LPNLKDICAAYLHGRRKTAVFALTSRCNCKCVMCDMHRQAPEEISLTDAKRVLDTLARNGFLIAYFTGGEPTLHPDIVDIVSYAGELGLVTTMTTNGTPSKALLSQLKDAGLYLLSVSLDHWDPDICENIRKYRKIFERQTDTLKYLKEIGLRTYALAYLNPILLRDGVDKLVSFANDELGVPLGFCYPTNCDANSYSLGGELAKEEPSNRLGDEVKRLLDLKRSGRQIANLYCYMKDAANFPNKHPSFHCRGGEDVVYVDWLGDVYPCFLKREKLFNAIRDREPRFLMGVQCDDCLINCFREPSFLTEMFHPPTLFFREAYRSYSSRQLFK